MDSHLRMVFLVPGTELTTSHLPGVCCTAELQPRPSMSLLSQCLNQEVCSGVWSGRRGWEQQVDRDQVQTPMEETPNLCVCGGERNQNTLLCVCSGAACLASWALGG